MKNENIFRFEKYQIWSHPRKNQSINRKIVWDSIFYCGTSVGSSFHRAQGYYLLCHIFHYGFGKWRIWIATSILVSFWPYSDFWNAIWLLCYALIVKVSIWLEKSIWIFDLRRITIQNDFAFASLAGMCSFACTGSLFIRNFNGQRVEKWIDFNQWNGQEEKDTTGRCKKAVQFFGSSHWFEKVE